jgi:thioredoxin reductase (NADPH)
VTDRTERGSRQRPFDSAIVGGGPAGLSAAIYLGRMRRDALVIDDLAGRSLWSQVNRNYLGFPDGIEAAELRLLGQRQAHRYGATHWDGRVEDAIADDGLFRLEVAPSGASEQGSDENVAVEERMLDRVGAERISAPRSVFARTLVLATGVDDDFPEFVGRDECVGTSLFWCTICDGYESSGQRTLVIGHDEEAVSTALQILQFTDRVMLVSGRSRFEVPEERLAEARAEGVAVHESTIHEYRNDHGCIRAVRLADEPATVLAPDIVFAVVEHHPKNALALRLGLGVDELGYVLTDSEMKTSLAGVFAAGDVTRLHNHQVSSAVHEGGMAAAAANYFLYRPVQKASR